MAVVREITGFDRVELLEPIDDAPAGSRGGVLELRDRDTAMVEITTPKLDPPPESSSYRSPSFAASPDPRAADRLASQFEQGRGSRRARLRGPAEASGEAARAPVASSTSVTESSADDAFVPAAKAAAR